MTSSFELRDAEPDLARTVRRIGELLTATDAASRRLPPTSLYNETWMLRLVVDWYAQHRPAGGLLTPAANATWYSEALLPSRFLRGRVNEGYTNADAAIGHFDLVGERGDIALRADCTQFLIVEAKMGSPLSAGTKNAPTFNQAARNVACMINMMDPTGSNASTPTDARFIVLAPHDRIERGMRNLVSPSALAAAIRARAEMRDAAQRESDAQCVRDAVDPRLMAGSLRAEVHSWESVIDEIGSHDEDGSRELTRFYRRCRRFNRLR